MECASVRKTFLNLGKHGGAVVLLALLSACTGMGFRDLSETFHMSYKAESSSDSALVTFGVAESDMRDSPYEKVRAYAPESVCLYLNVSGTGINRHLADGFASCDNFFPGFGFYKHFEWGSTTALAASVGSRRFDVIGIPLRNLGGHECPEEFELGDAPGVVAPAKAPKVRSGKKDYVVIEPGVSPIHFGSNEGIIKPDGEALKLVLKQNSSGLALGNPYGCKELKVSPAPASDGVITTGMREMFSEFECPTGATAITLVIAGKKSISASCGSDGKATLPSFKLESYDLMASMWDWFLPKVVLTVWKNDKRVDSRNLKIKYSEAGNYKSLKSSDGSYEWKYAVGANESDFKLYNLSATDIVLSYLDNNVGLRRYISIPYAANEATRFAWTSVAATRSTSVSAKLEAIETKDLDVDDFQYASSAPAWSGTNSEISFVRARGDSKEYIMGGLGGDPNYPSDRRAVIYRSPNAGQNWYLVHLGGIAHWPLDVLAVSNVNGNAAKAEVVPGNLVLVSYMISGVTHVKLMVPWGNGY